jgi:hypothetical protein
MDDVQREPALVVQKQFGDYQVGDLIWDPDVIETVMKERATSVIRIMHPIDAPTAG